MATDRVVPRLTRFAIGGALLVAAAGCQNQTDDAATSTTVVVETTSTTLSTTTMAATTAPATTPPPVTTAASASTVATVSSEPAATTPGDSASGFSADTWFESNAELFISAGQQMEEFLAVQGELQTSDEAPAEMARLGTDLSTKYATLASTLDGETDPLAVLMRDAFDACSDGFLAGAASATLDLDELEAAQEGIGACADGLRSVGEALNG